MTWRILMVSVSSNAPLTCYCKSIKHINYLWDSSFPSSNWEHPESNSISWFFKTKTLFLPQQHGWEKKEKNLLSSWGEMSFFNASISSCNPLRVKPRYSSASSWRPCSQESGHQQQLFCPTRAYSRVCTYYCEISHSVRKQSVKVSSSPPPPSYRQTGYAGLIKYEG